jgi:lysophospholipase L1-like esterase
MRHILFGDSIGFGVGDYEFGGWATRLRLFIDAQKKDKTHNLINLSVSGNTTRDLLARLMPETKARIRPNETREDYTLLLAIGTNDARIDKANPARNISEHEYMSNLKKLIVDASEFYCRTVVIGLPLVDETLTMPFKEQNFYTNEAISLYESASARIADETNSDFIAITSLWANIDVKTHLADGLHPNTQGHQLFFEQVRAFLF